MPLQLSLPHRTLSSSSVSPIWVLVLPSPRPPHPPRFSSSAHHFTNKLIFLFYFYTRRIHIFVRFCCSSFAIICDFVEWCSSMNGMKQQKRISFANCNNVVDAGQITGSKIVFYNRGIIALSNGILCVCVHRYGNNCNTTTTTATTKRRTTAATAKTATTTVTKAVTHLANQKKATTKFAH